jgi:hypothetical protein
VRRSSSEIGPAGICERSRLGPLGTWSSRTGGQSLYVKNRHLIRFDGLRNRSIANLGRLGIGELRTDIQVLDSGMIWLQGDTGAAVLRSDGRVFATTKARFPKRVPRRRFGPPAAPTADPSGSAVAFVRTRSSPPSLEVYVLRRAQRRQNASGHTASVSVGASA